MIRSVVLSILISSTAFSRDIEVLLYGDAGRGTTAQSTVGQGMFTADQTQRFDFALSMGDNQYLEAGAETMKKIFENPYKSLISRGLVFYQTLGNHDMEFGRRRKQLQYSAEQNVVRRGVGGWALPADDYEIHNDQVRFIVTNTSSANLMVNLPETRMEWLERSLCGAREKWVFLVMHYPMWSSNSHGDNPTLQRKLSTILKRCRPHALLAGHDHGAEILMTPLGIRQMVIGNASEATLPNGRSAARSEYKYGDLGFGRLSLSDEAVQISLYDRNGNLVHKTPLTTTDD